MSSKPADPSLAEALMHRVTSVGDPKTRVALLKALCPTLPSEALAEARVEIARRAGLRETAAQETLVALSEALARMPPRGGAAPSTRDEGELESGARKTDRKNAGSTDWGTGRPLTLGERKTLARRPDRKILERAMRDVHPDVIAELLLNPRLTETDVARMCSSQHATPAVLLRVFGDPRWATRPMVRLALAANPKAPVEIVLALLPLLSRDELRGIADDLRLSSTVRERARGVLAPRGRPGRDEGETTRSRNERDEGSSRDDDGSDNAATRER